MSACSYCSFNYTILSKLETMEEDREMILGMVGAPDLSLKKVHNKTSGKNIQDVTEELFSELTREEGEALADIYELDLEMFGYDKNLYLEMTQNI